MSERSRRWLIVNGDDFGLSPGVNHGIVNAHRLGILTSTSLMVDRPAAADAVLRASEVERLSVGLHLELEGAAADDPRAAVEGQLARFQELMGRAPTHIDSHHDCHRDPETLPHVLGAARRLNIPVRGHSPVRCHTRFYGQWGGETHLEGVSVETLLDVLMHEVAAGVNELICHPGYTDEALDSSYIVERQAELETLCHPRVRQTLWEARIELLGFRNLPAVLTGRRTRRSLAQS